MGAVFSFFVHSTGPQQGSSHNNITFYRNFINKISCLVQEPNMAKKINNGTIVLHYMFHTIIFIDLIKLTPPIIHQACIIARRKKTSEGDLVQFCVGELYLFEDFDGLLATPMHLCSPHFRRPHLDYTFHQRPSMYPHFLHIWHKYLPIHFPQKKSN